MRETVGCKVRVDAIEVACAMMAFTRKSKQVAECAHIWFVGALTLGNPLIVFYANEECDHHGVILGLANRLWILLRMAQHLRPHGVRLPLQESMANSRCLPLPSLCSL